MKVFIAAGLALLLHVLLGWWWTMFAALLIGAWHGARGWLVGGAGVGLSWLLLLIYNFQVAPEPVGRMTDTLGGLLNNMPGAVIVGITLLLGVLLGIVGGGLGTQLGALLRARSAAR